MLPFHMANSATLPDTCSAIVCVSDLQGRELGPRNRLLGEVVADELIRMVRSRQIPAVEQVLLAGDMFDYEDCHKRGGSGEVLPVWESFCRSFPTVAGVLGNHDILEKSQRLPKNGTLLDSAVRKIGSFTIGGVSGIIGDPKRLQRKSEGDFLCCVEAVIAKRPDILLLHQGPDDPSTGRRGEALVRKALEDRYRGLTVFGHAHWEWPFLISLGAGQAINVDARVVVITPATCK
ncbi:metallophosphoesterase [Allohahella marinimesophila]|uniref:Metallophosphoesterase n=1 Tax=Allohahella marinimesophila TaxID=1054972 RepID=A0ABP7Q7I3_9GAMM